MKTFSLFALITVVILGISISFIACGRKHNGNLTPAQGAQATSEGMTTALNILNTGVQLSNLASTGGMGVNTASQGLTEFAAANVKATGVGKFAARLSPTLHKAQSVEASAEGFPVAFSCATGMSTTAPINSTNSLTVDYDGVSTFTLTFNACLNGAMLTNGEMQISSGTSEVYIIGSADSPFTVTDFVSATSTTAIDMFQANMSMLYTPNTSSPGSDTIAVSGTLEEWNYVIHTHDFDTLTNLSITSESTTTSINTTNNSVDTLTVNGSQSRNIYVSDTDSTIRYNEELVLSNFIVVYKTGASGNGNDYLNINGTYYIVNTPEVCLDGTFTITTTNDIQIDPNGLHRLDS